MLWKVNTSFMVKVPAHGGELTEGIIGSPRFINPLLAIGDADKDLSTLIYSGLMRATPEGLIPDLAESYTISEDGLTYDFILREDAMFQDGEKVTSDDIEFTITKALDPALKSPKRGNWDGITVQKVSDREIRFILKQPYGPFLENTVLGILPKHIWKDATADQFSFSEYNINPIGSGPYKVKSVDRNSSGVPTKYTLKSFSKFTLGEPYIKTLSIQFYSSEEALREAFTKGDIESAYGFSAQSIHELATNEIRIEESVLPRVFGVFLNQNQATVFAHKEVREALNASIDRNSIVANVLFGYGTSINNPIPPKDSVSIPDTRTEDERLQEASTILGKAGWTKNTESGIWELVDKKTKKVTSTLSFSLSTGDATELKAAAEEIQGDWEKLGAKINLQIFETGDLNQNIIRPRKYDALLFGEIVGRDLDLYPFWHSSQRNDPGLNIALYVNSTADKLLEEARATSDFTRRDTLYTSFAAEVAKDVPVIFTYSPSFLYILKPTVEGFSLGLITNPSERFGNIYKWYIETDNVWSIFTQ